MSEQWDYRPGTLIPGTKYQVVSRMGAGGMGTVYEVEDVSVEKRFVLKTIHVKYAGHNVAVERFVREAKALGKLEHKNIVQVVTAGVTTDALQLRYFVMEKLTGHSLRTILHSKGALALDAACRFMIELMAALNAAHDAGIIHRDIKPENIFIARDSVGVTTLKLLDFGIMTSTGTRTTDRKGFMGTARYAAPEQMDDKHEATPQSDLYAASLVFYELVCGSGPFDELDEVPELLEAHRVKPPPSPVLFRPDLPASLSKLILRGLAKDPADRQPDAFSYAEDVERELRALREGSPTSRRHDARRPGDPPSFGASPAPSSKNEATALDEAPPSFGSVPPAPSPAAKRGTQVLAQAAPEDVAVLSHSDIDRQAAASFARAHGATPPPPNVEPNETIGATHSTMPGLPSGRGRAWMLVALGVVVFAAALGSIKLLQKKDITAAAAAGPSATTVETAAASASASASATPAATPTATTTAAATATGPSAPGTTTRHRHGVKAPTPVVSALPGSGL